MENNSSSVSESTINNSQTVTKHKERTWSERMFTHETAWEHVQRVRKQTPEERVEFLTKRISAFDGALKMIGEGWSEGPVCIKNKDEADHLGDLQSNLFVQWDNDKREKRELEKSFKDITNTEGSN